MMMPNTTLELWAMSPGYGVLSAAATFRWITGWNNEPLHSTPIDDLRRVQEELMRNSTRLPVDTPDQEAHRAEITRICAAVDAGDMSVAEARRLLSELHWPAS